MKGLRVAMTALGAVALGVLVVATFRDVVAWRGLSWVVVVPWVLLGAVALLMSLGSVAMLPVAGAPRPRAPAHVDVGEDVDVLIPVRDEDVSVLERTLDGVARLGHPGVRVVVVDDSSSAAHRAAIGELAASRGAVHLVRGERSGYKAGALNAALRATGAPFVAVLDVDHVPARDFLRVAFAHLADEGVGGVQLRISWANADSWGRRLTAMLQYQFYGVVQWERASRGNGIFAGSAAVFRRSALERVGGFPEETLVEDIDLTLLMQLEGLSIRYDDRVGAVGLLPWTGADVARQMWRWSHGTTRVLQLRMGRVLRAPIALIQKMELLLSAAGYTLGGLWVLAAAFLGLLALARAPVGPAMSLLFVTWVIILTTHTVTTAFGQHRAGRPWWRDMVGYHYGCIAYTPVLLASSMAAFISPKVHDEGRVSKKVGARSGGHVMSVLAMATGALGVGLAFAAWYFFQQGSLAWIWAADLAIGFVLAPMMWGALPAKHAAGVARADAAAE